MQNGVCVRHAYAPAVFTCSLPTCNATHHKPTLMVQRSTWAAYLRFELGSLAVPPSQQLVDAELQLTGTRRCFHRSSSRLGVNFTHRLHLLRKSNNPPQSTELPAERDLLAQWSHLVYDGRFRLPLALRPHAALGARPRKSISLTITDATGSHAAGAGAHSFDAAARAGPAVAFDEPVVDPGASFAGRFDAARTTHETSGSSGGAARRLRDSCSYYSSTRPEVLLYIYIPLSN